MIFPARDLYDGGRRRTSSAGPRGATLWKILLFISGVISLTLALVIRPYSRSHLTQEAGRILEAAEKALDSNDIPGAIRLAQIAIHRATRLGQSAGPGLLILGLAREQQAQNAPPAQRLICLAAATQHLTEALSAYSTGDESPRIRFHLARCLYARGQLTESIRLFKQCLTEYPAGKVEALKLLTSAYTDSAQPELEQAQLCIQELIRTPDLSTEDLAWAWSVRHDICLQLGRADLLSGLDVASQPGDQPWLVLLASGCEAFDSWKFDEAVGLLRKLTTVRELSRPLQARVWYLLGVAAKEGGQVETALEAFARLEKEFPEFQEAHEAAAFATSILLQEDRVDEAIAAIRVAAQLHSNWQAVGVVPIAAPQLGKLFHSVLSRLRQLGQFELAEPLIQYLRLAPCDAASERMALEFYETWAVAQLREAKQLPTEQATQAAYDAEQLYRTAGSIAIRLADCTQSDESRQWLWRAAEDLVTGRGYLEATNALERLLTSGASGDLRARALALMCGALECSGKNAQVHEVAESCVREFPDHPAATTACYYLARCQIGFGELAQAEVNLRAVLGSTSADVSPTVQQQARLLLAHLLYDLCREEEAIPRVQEILQGSTEADQVFEARLLMAECLRRRSQRSAARVLDAQSERAKAHYQQLQENDLAQSLRLFSSVQRELAAINRAGRLTELEADWLRQSRWGMADCMYEANRVPEAMELYKLLAQTYTEPSDWLAAQLQTANCHVRLNQMDLALDLMRQTQIRLGQLSVDAREQVRLGMQPERWREWLDWMGQM